MDRIAPKPPMVFDRKRITHVFSKLLTDKLTPVDKIFQTTGLGIPDVSSKDWSLEITGLIDSPTSLSFEELKRFPKTEVESVFVCSGNPDKPTVALRRAANVIWGGVDLASLLTDLGIQDEASHIWAYGLDYGESHGETIEHNVKDMPVSRLREGDVLIAYELNGAPLPKEYGFPARLIIPGYYGNSNVKWLCRLELADRCADNIFTRLYSDPDYDADPSGNVTKRVWEVAPECIIVSPAHKSEIPHQAVEIWGWAWSDCPVQSVEISVDGGENWLDAGLEQANGRAWQRFTYEWTPPDPGTFDIRCRTTDIKGRSQPDDGARNSIYSAVVNVTG